MLSKAKDEAAAQQAAAAEAGAKTNGRALAPKPGAKPINPKKGWRREAAVGLTRPRRPTPHRGTGEWRSLCTTTPHRRPVTAPRRPKQAEMSFVTDTTSDLDARGTEGDALDQDANLDEVEDGDDADGDGDGADGEPRRRPPAATAERRPTCSGKARSRPTTSRASSTSSTTTATSTSSSSAAVPLSRSSRRRRLRRQPRRPARRHP